MADYLASPFSLLSLFDTERCAMAKPAYPDTLKKAAWDKQKGVVAKLVKSETGIGGALDGLQALYNQLPWEKVDEGVIAHAKTADELKKHFEAGKVMLSGPLEGFRKKSFEVGNLAKKVADDFKKNKLVPKSSTEYLLKMSEGASNFATIMRDSAMASLKKVHDAMEAFDGHMVKVKEMGEKYVATRQKALHQMEDLENAFKKLKNDLTQSAATADKAAEVGGPQNVQKIVPLLENGKKSYETMSQRWKTEGDVNTNPVQRDARMKMPKYPVESMQQFLVPYAVNSEPLFNKIMACTANIIQMKQEAEALLGAIETSLEIAKETGGEARSLPQLQELAKQLSAQAMDEGVKMKDNNEKIAKSASIMPNALKNMKDPRTPQEQKAQTRTLIDPNLGEIKRRVGTLEAAISKVANLQKRMNAMPKEAQADKVIKAEAAKMVGVVQMLQLLVKQGRQNLVNSEKIAEEIRQLL
jgi:hypothetical protein